MKVRSRKNASLARAILQVTLLIGVVTITATVAASLASAYRLASAQSAERQQAYLRVAESAISSRLHTAADAADIAAADAQSTAAGDNLTRTLGVSYAAYNATIDGLWLVRRDSTPIASYPGSLDPATATSPDLVELVSEKRNGFYYDVGGQGHTATLWVMRPTTLANGVDAQLLIRIRTDFVSLAADQVASGRDGRSAVVAQHSDIVAAGAAGPSVKLSDADYGEVDDDHMGVVRLTAPALGSMRGYYLRLDGFAGLPWRLIVAEPSAAIFDASVRSIAPTVVVLVLGGLTAVAFAWGLAQWLVKPLREVESASLEAAAGAYVPQLKVNRNDEVGRLSEAFNVVALRLNALHDISRLLASASKTTQVQQAIVESVGHLLGPGIAAVYLRDARSAFHLACVSSGDMSAAAAPLSLEQTRMFERCVASGALVVPPPNELPPLAEERSEISGRALVAPLFVGEERLGVVVVEQPDRHPYSEAELEMVRTLTTQASVALLNSRLFEEERISRRTAEALHLISEHLVHPVSLSEALKSATSELGNVLGSGDVVLAIHDRAILGLPHTPDPIREGVVLELGSRIERTDRVGWITSDEDDEVVAALLSRLDASSVLIEQVAPGTPYAAELAVLDWKQSHDPRESELIDSAAQILDLALEKAYFVERDRSRARNLETIFRISQAVGSSLEVRVVLNRVLDVVQMIFAADAVSLMVYDEARRSVSTAMARGSISDTLLHFEVAPGDDLPGRVFITGTPARLDEVDQASSDFEAAAASLGLRSILAVPLLARGRPIGVLSVFSAGADAFDEEDMGLLQTFGSQAALAIDTARLYGHERDVADTLQQSILPDQLPEYAAVDTASVYEPAALEAEIGGDYYDLFRSPDGSIVIAMADVCGKGVSAATKTSMIKYSIRALVASGLTPAACMEELNDLVASKGDPSDIVTVIVGFMDIAHSTLTWANGGHPPGLLLHRDTGRVERLDTTGPLLGAVSGARFEQEVARLGPGDIVLLYTDGVSESRNRDRFFGEGRIRRALKYGGTADAVTRRLLSALHRFAPGDLRDDVAVLAVRVRDSDEVDAAAKTDVQR